MAEIKKVWGVRDPSDVSEMDDIFFELKVPVELANYILGTGASQFKKENHKFYDDAGSAKKDAEARMKARDKTKKTADVEIAANVVARVIAAALRVDTREYEDTTGHKPKGTGLWLFQIGNDKRPFEHNGPFAEASKKALEKAKSDGARTVKVLT
jgi:uncharacterized membrane protein YkoI